MSMSKIARITGFSLLFFVIIFLISGILLNVYFNKKIIESVKEQVSESTHGQYALILDGLTINIFTRTITVKNIIIAPVIKETSSKAQFVFKAKILRTIDFSILPYFTGHDLLIDRVEFEQPQISIFQGYKRMPKRTAEPAENDFSIFKLFSKQLNSLSIGHIDIMNSKINIYKNGTDTLSVFSSNDNSLSIKNFNVNSETEKTSRLFIADKFEIVMNKFFYHIGNGLYTLQGKRLYTSYIDSTLTIDSLQVVPNFSKKEFAEEAGRQITRVKIISSKIEAKMMDVKLFFEYNWLVINKVGITGCSMDIYRDNTLPIKHIIRPSVQAILKSLPFFVSVDTIEMKNGEAVYQELNPAMILPGKLSLNKINVIITGVQNDTSLYSKKSNITVKLNAYIMNQGRFRETCTFPLINSEDFFYCSGSCTSMPLASFNPMIQHTKNISIISGQLDYASFSFTANKNSSYGTMKFIYHDLKVEVLNKLGNKIGFREKVKTFLMNKIVIKDRNPDKNGVVRISNIHAEHNPYRFFPYYSMQSILSGIEPAVEGENKAKWLKKKK